MAPSKVVAKYLLLIALVVQSNCEIVEISDGKIQGRVMQSQLGQDFHAFHRIPYAQPPIGDLRFRDPIVNEPWDNVLNGTTFGPMCYQANARPDFEISEDCLRLNVFTKNVTASKPVIVFIHGGAFEIGSANDQGSPRYLMDRDVVLVTFNYRLSALGFLAMETKEIPGNAAMKDQIFALRWVQKNIEKFGGDPKKVTVAGLSAGAFSTTAFLVSPMAKGIFHGIIAMSGSIAMVQPYATNNLDNAQTLATMLDCPVIATIDEKIKCLNTKTPLEIVNIELKRHPECEMISWMPVIEEDFGQERFFIEDPVELLKNGTFEKVPVMIGRTADEFVDVVPRLMYSDGFEDFSKNFSVWAPDCFFYNEHDNKSVLTEALRTSYLPFDTIDVRSFDALNNLFADSYIGYPVYKLVHLISNFTEVYYYKFTYTGRFTIFRYPLNEPYGVHHVDDLQYVFDVDYFLHFIQPTDPEGFMVDRMTRIWEHFAWNGNPNYNPTLIQWAPHNVTLENFMDIGTHLIPKNGMFLARYGVWDNATAIIHSSASLKFPLALIVAIVSSVITKVVC